MKKNTIILWIIILSILAIIKLGDKIFDGAPVANRNIAQEQTETTNGKDIMEQTDPETNHPVAIPVLSLEEAKNANIEALTLYIKIMAWRFTRNLLLIVISIFCITIFILAKPLDKLKHIKATESEKRKRDQEDKEGNRLLFLDVMKGLAIIGVICDHSICWSKLCRLSFLPGKATFFSVPLFIVCAGYTSAMSLENARKKNVSTQSWIIKKQPI